MSREPKKKYNWPPPSDPYIPKQRNSIHSILTALPIIMLVAGLYMYYSAESEQTQSAPIRAESKDLSGIFTGLSVVSSGQQGRHYLWLEVDGSAKGIRVRPEQAQLLEPLKRGALTELKIAPTVHESTVYWAWYVKQEDNVIIDDSAGLQ